MTNNENTHSSKSSLGDLGAALFIALLVFLPFSAFSQSANTNSPYSRYGYGQLADQTFAPQRGMGGIGFGLRNPKMINPLNPAAFSAVDSMTFMLDFAVKGQLTLLDDPDYGKARRYNAGLEYVAMQFPLAKGLGMGIGLEPVSYVGYRYGETLEAGLPGVNAERTNKGSGGMSKVYTSLSYNFFNHLSVGVNVGYLFGDIVHEILYFNYMGNSNRIAWTDSLRVRALTYEVGLQYSFKPDKNSEFVFGAVYSPKIKMDGLFKPSEVSFDANGYITGHPKYYQTRDSVFQLPETYGIGISYRKINKLTVGADFLYQKWANAKFFNETNILSNRMKISLGAEYIPDATNNKFLRKMHYRAGAYFADSYIIDNHGSKFKEYGLSLGFGIPMVDRRSMLNMAFEYARYAPNQAISMNEQYCKFTLSYTFNELWFFKRKLQ